MENRKANTEFYMIHFFERFLTFLMMNLCIQYSEIKNGENKNGRTKIKFKYKLGGLSTWELVSDITDYKLDFMTEKFKTRDPIWRNEIIKKIYIFVF